LKRYGVVFAVIALALAAGCARRTAGPESRAATATASAPVDPTFEDTQHGFAVTILKDWTARKDEDPPNVLTLAGPHDAKLAIAVPKLPPHVPGIIPLPAVEKGYVDDVRKRLRNVQETESAAIKVAGCPARRFAISGGDSDAGARTLVVVAIVNGDRLYIVSGEGPAYQQQTVRAGVEAIRASWKWIK
jgi:hypothetical protein